MPQISSKKIVSLLSLLVLVTAFSLFLLVQIINNKEVALQTNNVTKLPETTEQGSREQESEIENTETITESMQTKNGSSENVCNPVLSGTFDVNQNQATYQIIVSNDSVASCKDITLTIHYPRDEKYLASSKEPDTGGYLWQLGTIEANVKNVLEITTQLDAEFRGIDICVSSENITEKCISLFEPVALYSPQTNFSNPMTETNDETNLILVPKNKECGIWVWNSAASMTEVRMNNVLSSIKNAGFNAIYITIDDLHDYDMKTYSAALNKFVSKANALGLAVDAASGEASWAKEKNRYKGFEMIAFAKTYNKSNAKLRGFQYDVEPYLLPEYEGSKETVLTDFVDFIAESEKQLEDSGLLFSVVIPHFYDSEQAWTPEVSFKGQQKHAFNHLVDILDSRQGNTIIIMAYRNFFNGPGGVKELVTPEINLAQKTKIIVAQETGDVEPDYVTHFNTSKSNLYSVLNQTYTHFSNNLGFGGTAVHYLDSFLDL